MRPYYDALNDHAKKVVDAFEVKHTKPDQPGKTVGFVAYITASADGGMFVHQHGHTQINEPCNGIEMALSVVAALMERAQQEAQTAKES